MMKNFYDAAMEGAPVSTFYWDEDTFSNGEYYAPDNWEEICDVANAEIEKRYQDVVAAYRQNEKEQTLDSHKNLRDEAESFVSWLSDFFDHIFWTEHPEFVEE